MKSDKWLKLGTKVQVTFVEPADFLRGIHERDVGVVIHPDNGYSGMLYDEKKFKLAWCPKVRFEQVEAYMAHYQLELV